MWTGGVPVSTNAFTVVPMHPPCACSFFRNPLGSVAFFQKLVQKEAQDPAAAAAGSRPGSALGQERAPYELDSEEEAAAGEEGSEEEGPSREPSGFFRAFKTNGQHSKPHTAHGSKAHTAAGSKVTSSSPSAVVGVAGRGSSSSAAAGTGGAAAAAPGHVGLQVAGAVGPVVGANDAVGSPRGHATISAVAASVAPEMAGYAGAVRGSPAGRGLL
jgi:hypothetical protein